MATMNSKTVTVVIRSCGERTTDACRRLIEKQVAPENVLLVQEVPFEQALRKTYTLAIERNARWTVTVDADVLLRHDAVARLVNAAEQAAENVVMLEGLIYDKILGKCRQAGHRIYRTSLLPRALELVPVDGTQIRPEFHVLQQLEAEDWVSARMPDVLGVHDFEQYYCDLYRKSFVHGQKHLAWLPALIERCRHECVHDSDFRAILLGLSDGIASMDSAKIDVSAYRRDAQFLQQRLQLTEKPPLAADDIDDAFVETVLATAGLPGEVLANGRATARQRAAARIRQAGLLRSIPHFAGVALDDLARYLKCRE